MPTLMRSLALLACLAASPLRAEDAPLPPGTTPCDFWAYSADEDPKGLNVRAEPGAKAPVLGVIPGPVKVKGGEPGEKVRAQFRVLGYRDGWMLVENLPGDAMRADDKPYSIKGGRGWVSARLVGFAIYDGALMREPRDEAEVAAWLSPEKNRARSDGNSIRYKRMKVLSCKGEWAEVETDRGRGWAKHLCGNSLAVCT